MRAGSKPTVMFNKTNNLEAIPKTGFQNSIAVRLEKLQQQQFNTKKEGTKMGTSMNAVGQVAIHFINQGTKGRIIENKAGPRPDGGGSGPK